jgi:hypothetical protein
MENDDEIEKNTSRELYGKKSLKIGFDTEENQITANRRKSETEINNSQVIEKNQGELENMEILRKFNTNKEKSLSEVINYYNDIII